MLTKRSLTGSTQPRPHRWNHSDRHPRCHCLRSLLAHRQDWGYRRCRHPRPLSYRWRATGRYCQHWCPQSPRQARKITVVERKDRCERLVCVHDEAPLRPLPGREMMWASLQTTQLMYASCAKNQMQPAIFLQPRKLEHSCSRSNPVNQQVHSKQTRSWRRRRICRVRRIQVCMARKGLSDGHNPLFFVLMFPLKLCTSLFFVSWVISLSWARTNRPKNKEDGQVSFEGKAASRKKRKWCTICCSWQKSRCVNRVASHISTRAWIAAQKPGSTVRISFPLLDFYSSTFVSRSRSTALLATHGAAPQSIGREVEKKCPIGASKHGRSG